MEETVEISLVEGEGSDSNLTAESETSENKFHRFGQSLDFPEEVLEAVAETDQGKLLLDKVIEHLEDKDRQIEEYQSALNDFVQNMSQQQG